MEQLNLHSDRHNTPTQDRLVAHDEKVEFLDAFAVLAGYKEHYGQSLPDGKRPDVLRVDTQNRLLFIGDAKNTEGPHCRETQVRLLRYLRWLAAYVKREASTGVFALCFGNVLAAQGWVDTVSLLSREVGLSPEKHRIHQFDPSLALVLFTYDQSSK